MARILLNRIWDELGKIWKELQSSVAQEQEISLESTRVSGIQLATLINQRLQQRKQKNSENLTLVFNENDLLPFSFFETGKRAGNNVCCLVRRIKKLEDLEKLIDVATDNSILQATLLKWYGIDPIKERDQFKNKAPNVYLPYASGFLVGGDYLLTNRHVVEEQNKLGEFSAVFKYEADFRRQESHPDLLSRLDKYEFDHTFWVTSPNPELDYVLLKLKPLQGEPVSVQFDKVDLAKTLEGVVPRISTQTLNADSALKEGIKAEFLTLIETKDFIAPDPIHMIQHPGGRPKQVVVFNNRLVNVYENFLEYDTDAEPGSSGSPLFNTDWQVVGIHQAALLDEKSDERKVKGYLGIRMDCILADLKKQQLSNPQLQDFLEKYVDRTTPPTQPQVFILAGRKRDSVLEDDYAELELKTMESLRKSINEKMKLSDPDVRVVSISGNPAKPDVEALKLAIQDINKQRNPEQKGELAIELLINNSGVRNTTPLCIKLYYSAANDRAKKLAESLQKVLKEGNKQFHVSALPDSYTSSRGLYFCRNVNLPAVVIFVGDLANASDREYIKNMQRDPANAASLATSLSKGILDALKALEN